MGRNGRDDMKRTRNPYSNTAKRKAALAWMAARGITQPRGSISTPLPMADVALGRVRVRKLAAV